MTDGKPAPLKPDALRRRCDPGSLGFETTAEVEPLRQSIGQGLAMQAVRFGLEVDHPGYNVFATGLSGSGRTTMIRQLLEARAADEPTPSDWCYVYNFDEAREPSALQLPSGRGPHLRDDVAAMLRELRASLAKALQSEEFRKRRDEIAEEAMEKQRALIENFQQQMEEERYVSLTQTPAGYVVAPALGNEPIDEKRFQTLPEEQREEILARRREMEKVFAEVQRQAREFERQAQRRVIDLQRSAAHDVVAHCVGEVKARWENVPAVLHYLNRMAEDIVRNAERFAEGDDASSSQGRQPGEAEDPTLRYKVNVIVCHEPDSGAPVVREDNPTYHNLIGRIEHRVEFGTMVADYSQITAGAIHQANGGYLLLDATDLLQKPIAWTALKNALRTGSIRLEEIIEYTSLIATTTLKPEPIPLSCRIILIGDPYTYYMLHAYDEDFRELFKVRADFSTYMDRDGAAERGYAAFIAARCEEESLPAFEAEAVARIVEFGSRLAGHRDHLSTRFGAIGDLVREAAFFARSAGRDTVTFADVSQAIEEREKRVNRPERELLRLIENNTLAVEPEGHKIGQLYGLAVLSAAEHQFARPIKVECSAFMGTSGVVDIEREVRLGGPLHNKGVLVLSGYLGDLFAQDHPLIMSASLSFDQLYEEVEGDSASAAELYTLISAIAEVPLNQGIAITGALNQDGDIRPIGGVTTKIEGFYRACQRRGLTGDQGVIVPARNASNLVLTDEVIEAVRAGRFHVWPIRKVEEGWTILSGLPAGSRGADGEFPPESVYGRAAARLREWATGWRDFGKPVREGRQPETETTRGREEPAEPAEEG
ncbi:MAG: AAA family ATPase [Gemmatimonadetes bacterium]|uniref:endopeptidase La n=1 Tax=Candidatus Kutchimonas denitrificans TaxID=3056748 RepID=A0AAE4Z5M5_9BACT|nr:AAA family ATPase [Gemmatimonadota bacterium]NIR74214.1 AAA family ATPase [Candidatus Kutchimonas denitrificans]NIR99836.1 AAA family ATPase [Gemmatimonadota bacterium]NIT65425.1 AAA family ATPase [Gemmatimonadota bacterium]NIU51790.1 AAA family ATPase [Gemmatimonadota bacterium]